MPSVLFHRVHRNIDAYFPTLKQRFQWEIDVWVP